MVAPKLTAYRRMSRRQGLQRFLNFFFPGFWTCARHHLFCVLNVFVLLKVYCRTTSVLCCIFYVKHLGQPKLLIRCYLNKHGLDLDSVGLISRHFQYDSIDCFGELSLGRRYFGSEEMFKLLDARLWSCGRMAQPR